MKTIILKIKCRFHIFQQNIKSRQIVKGLIRATPPQDDSKFLRKGWLLDPGMFDLPDWFEENRVQGHTRLEINHMDWGFDTPTFLNAAVKFKELGAGAFTRHVKTCSHNPWWPTNAPLDSDGNPIWDGRIDLCNEDNPKLSQVEIPNGQNIVREFINQTHDQGLHLIAYYWHMAEKVISDDHPTWVCQEPDCSEEIIHKRGPWLDISEPAYRDIVLARLLELAEMGVDGFYFDFRHLPEFGCWCSALAAAFEDEMSMPPPTTKSLAKKEYRQFLDFKAYKIEDTFRYWKQAVKSQFPEVVFIVSATGLPVPHNRIETTNLARIADSTKNEYKHALNLPMVKHFFKENRLAEPDRDIRLAFGWVLMRDSADGRPPHIWEGAFPDHEHALAAAAALVTYGAIANMNVDERILTGRGPRPRFTPVEGLKAAFDLGNKVSPFLGHSRPLHWAAVHFSELTRNRRGERLVDAWEEVLWPALGAFGGFVRSGIPVGIVNDYQLEKNLLDGYRVLYLPNPDELSRSQRLSIRNFVNRGGILLKNNLGSAWSNPQTNASAERSFREEIQHLIECFRPPVRVVSRVGMIHAVAFEKKQSGLLLVAVTNDFSWVRWVPGGKDDPDEIESEDDETGDIGLEDIPRPLMVDDVDVFVSNRKRPNRVFEAISETPLRIQDGQRGYKVRLPGFQTMSLLVIQE